STADLATSGVAVRVQDARAAVCSFTRKCEFGAVAIESSAPPDQLLDARWSFFYQDPGRFRVDQAVAGVDGVLQLESDLLLIAQRHCDAALRILCVRFSKLLLGYDKHTAGGGQSNCCAQACDASANHNKVYLCLRGIHRSRETIDGSTRQHCSFRSGRRQFSARKIACS